MAWFPPYCFNRQLRPVAVLLFFFFSLNLLQVEAVEARRRTPPPSPVKISDVVISPDPFLIGKSPVTFSMLVELPPSLNGANVLEVSALITSPTRRSMSFVSHRRRVSSPSLVMNNSSIPVVLVWDGKDQYQNLVPDGSYYYEIRAKLMEDEGFGPRTKIVSYRVQGTLDVLAYVGEVLPPVPPEPELPEALPDDQPEEGTSEGEVSEKEPEGEPAPLPEDVQVVEEGLKVREEPAGPQVPEAGKDPGQQFPEALPALSNENQDDIPVSSQDAESSRDATSPSPAP